MTKAKWLNILFIALLLCGVAEAANAQSTSMEQSAAAGGADTPVVATELEQARTFAGAKEYSKAIALYEGMYNKGNNDIYTEYLATLIAAKKYKEAERLAEGLLGGFNQSPTVHVELGNVYKLDGKEARATEQFETAVKKVNGDDMLTQRLAKAFTDIDQTDYAVQVYARASQLIGNPFIYSMPVAGLYAKAGQLDKAMDVLLAPIPGQYFTADNVKSLFLEWMGNDPKKLVTAQKNLLKHINAQPDNNYFSDLLTWVYTQKNDWDGALLQMEAVDERNNENGRRLIDFGRIAAAAKQYEAAFKAYDEVIAKGTTSPFYGTAKRERLGASIKELENTPAPTPAAISALMAQYRQVLDEFPLFYGSAVAEDYAHIAARYADSVDLAITILQTAIKHPATPKQLAGKMKLQMGDYYVLKGRVWDASLTYSQVDKEFKQDILGENARFSNAKLAYYRGDFDWAQHMLKVLKASTSELISNDAIYLSVLITENIEDSNTYPLQRFANAGLLMSQNKDAAALQLLDSIATAFPKHPLNDDILMEHANIAEKRHEYEKALGYLKNIADKYGEDVLGDDALFKSAKIYLDYLNDKVNAKKYYEKLIIDFPGSTFVQVARQKLRDINDGVTQ
ncbi:MAG: hypothetical protein H7257_03515 [Taibaiella sp.]|nr:hypothetical protein [Taibaiella sp.]